MFESESANQEARSARSAQLNPARPSPAGVAGDALAKCAVERVTLGSALEMQAKGLGVLEAAIAELEARLNPLLDNPDHESRPSTMPPPSVGPLTLVQAHNEHLDRLIQQLRSIRRRVHL